MRIKTKILFLALCAAAVSVGFFFLAAQSVYTGSVSFGKYRAQVFTLAEPPVAFFLAIGGMCIAALAMLLASVLFVTARGARRDVLLSHANLNVFRVRRSIKWLFLMLVACVAAIFAIVPSKA